MAAYQMFMKRTADGGVVLVSGDRIDIDLPGANASAESSNSAETVGHFVESLDGDGSLLQKQAVSIDNLRHVEFPTGNPDRPFGHVEARPDALFSVVVPVPTGARRLALVNLSERSQPAVEGEFKAQRPAVERRELFTIDIDMDDLQ